MDYSRFLGLTQFTVIALSVTIVAGCKLKPTHDMEEQPNIHPAYKPSSVFDNGSSARPVPAGAVPRISNDSADSQFADIRAAIATQNVDSTETSAIPFPITTDILLRGQQRFNIYCSMCHGRLGDGNGMIAQRGLTPPPSFHIDRLREVSDGHLYNVITNGYGQMFSYNDRVRPEDRWMIVAYIRALQASTASDNRLAHLTDADRRQLEGTRP